MKVLRSIIFSVLLLPFFMSAKANPDSVLSRHREYLLRTHTVGSEVMQHLVTAFDRATGRWRNIDYSNRNPAEWQIGYHVKNIHTLALYTAATKDSKLTLLPVIVSALDEWYKNRYKSTNWWHNEIGIPQMVRDILVLLQSDLTKKQFVNYLEIVNQFRINGTGANLIWSADIGLFYGLFTNDLILANKAASAIVSEIKISDGEGLKPDYSFHQHGARLQMYQYGRTFLVDNIRLAWELRGTPWEYPTGKVNLLADMFLRGWQWMARGIHTVPETMDRSASRVNALNDADIRLHLPFFADIAPAYSKEFMIAAQNQKEAPYTLKGFRGFPYSDFSVYHSRRYSSFVKTISTRTLPTESINYENLKGRLLNSGETYFVKDGTEYFNLMPVWDWTRLPGITAFDGADKIQRSDYNGIVSDGDIGLSAVDYKITDKTGDAFVSCRKSWFMMDGYMVCLMGNIQSTDVSEYYTVMDQARLKEPVLTGTKLFKNGFYPSLQSKYYYHNNFIYHVIAGARATSLYADTVSGNWYAINHSYAKDNIIDSVFMPVIIHDSSSREAAYFVSYARSSKDAARLDRNAPFRIVKNDANSQALIWKEQSLLIAFYEAGQLLVNGKSVTVNAPCLMLIRGERIYAADPLHKGQSLMIQYGKKVISAQLPADGATIKVR